MATRMSVSKTDDGKVSISWRNSITGEVASLTVHASDARWLARAILVGPEPSEWEALAVENARLRALADIVRERCRQAVSGWAPELRAALAAADAARVLYPEGGHTAPVKT